MKRNTSRHANPIAAKIAKEEQYTQLHLYLMDNILKEKDILTKINKIKRRFRGKNGLICENGDVHAKIIKVNGYDGQDVIAGAIIGFYAQDDLGLNEIAGAIEANKSWFQELGFASGNIEMGRVNDNFQEGKTLTLIDPDNDPVPFIDNHEAPSEISLTVRFNWSTDQYGYLEDVRNHIFNTALIDFVEGEKPRDHTEYEFLLCGEPSNTEASQIRFKFNSLCCPKEILSAVKEACERLPYIQRPTIDSVSISSRLIGSQQAPIERTIDIS